MKKKILALVLAGALVSGVTSVPAYAAKEDGGEGRPGGGPVQNPAAYSSEILTVPAGLGNGTYVGDAVVEPDDDDGFNHYPISVAVKVSDGSIESFLVTGASGNNAQYSKRAEEGINAQLSGKGAGEYKVDTVGMATCSSYAIVQAMNMAMQSESTLTSFSLGDAIYEKSGTSFSVTVTEPKEGTDYSDITIAHALGKFSQALEKDKDYSVNLVSENPSEIVYKVTILPTNYEIEDDDLVHSGTYNTLGQTLDVTVAGSSAGRIAIASSAAVEMNNNVLTLTGGNGETLADYINNIGQIEVSYTNENGEQVSDKYSTQWQHDIEPEFTGADFFLEDGSVNFAVSPFVNGAGADYIITVESSGFETLTAAVGGAAENPSDPNGGDVNNPSDPNGGDANKPSDSTDKTQGDGTNVSTGNPEKSSADITTVKKADKTIPKTGDYTPIAAWTSVLVLAMISIGAVVIRRRRRS